MNGLLIASAFLALLSPQQKGSVQVNVNAKNGDVITGERKFRVTVVSSNPVTQVEYYVGTELRDKDTSTPYEFAIDSLSETDGALKLRFKAYTTEQETGEALISVTIDNGLSKGAAFHVERGEAFAADSKWDDAITAGRIALRADEKSTAARFLLARAYLGKGDTAQAQKNAEDILEIEPGNLAALDLLSAIKLKAAFRTFASVGSSRTDALANIKDALVSAVTDRRKVLDAGVDAAGQPTGANLIAWSDAVLRADRYSLAIAPLRDAFEKDTSQSKLGNRLAYAYLRQGKAPEALQVVSQMQKIAPLDAFGFSTMAIAKAELGDVEGSDNAIREAILADSEDPSVGAAQAYIALKFVRYRLANQSSFNLNYDDLSGLDAAGKAESNRNLQKLVAQLNEASAASTVTLYFKQAMYNRLGEFPAARQAFEAAVLAEPANYNAYIEAGNRSLASTQLSNLPAEDKANALGYAAAMFEAALAAKPDSAQALTGLALVATIEGKMDQAVKWVEGATAANPDYAAGHVAASTAYYLAAKALGQQAEAVRTKSRQGNADAAERQQLELQARGFEDRAAQYTVLARDSATKGAKIDRRLEGQELNRPYSAWRYYSAGGRTPVLPQPR